MADMGIWEYEVAAELVAHDPAISFEDALLLVKHHRDQWRKIHGLKPLDPEMKFQ